MFKRLAMVWTLVVGVAASFGGGVPVLLCVGTDGHVALKSVAQASDQMCPPSPGERCLSESAGPVAVDFIECCLDVPVTGGVSVPADLPSRPSMVRDDLQACQAVASQIAQPYPYASSMLATTETAPPSDYSPRTIVLLV